MTTAIEPQSYSVAHIREQIDYWRLQGDTEQVAAWASVACLQLDKAEIDARFWKAKFQIAERAFNMVKPRG